MNSVHVIDHPIIRVKLTELRNYACDHRHFRALVEEVSMLMTYEITRTMPTRPRPIQTPLEKTTGVALAKQVTLVPILRAGLGMTSGVMKILPEVRVGHIGMERDEATAEPRAYYHKLPPDVAETEIIVTDPMLATGGSAEACIDFLLGKLVPIEQIRLMCIVAAPEGVQRLHEKHPSLPIFTAAIDRELNDVNYIVPGLGDAGDRIFGT